MEEEDLYEELPQTEADELYVDTDLPPPPLPGEQDDLYDDCVPCAPPLPPPLPRAPPPPPISPPPPPLPPNSGGRVSKPLVKRKSSVTSPVGQSPGIDMNEILQRRRQLQKVSSRTSEGMQMSEQVSSSGSVVPPPWQQKPQIDQNKKNEKPEWMKNLKRVGDRPPSACESSDGGVDKGGTFPFIQLKKTGISLGQTENEAGSTSFNDNETASPGFIKKPPNRPPIKTKPKPGRPAVPVASEQHPAKISVPSEGTKRSPPPPPLPPHNDLSNHPPPAAKPLHHLSSPPDPPPDRPPDRPPDPRPLPKPRQQETPPLRPGNIPLAPRISGQPPLPPEPNEPPPPQEPPPMDDDEDIPPDVSQPVESFVPPPDIRSLPKPGQKSTASGPLPKPAGTGTGDFPVPPHPASMNINLPPRRSPVRSPVSETAPRTRAEPTVNEDTSVPRYRRRPLPDVDISKPPAKPLHSKPLSLPTLPQLSNSELESEVDNLLADIEHNLNKMTNGKAYSEELYDDVAPEQKDSQLPSSFSLGGVTTTASTDTYPCDDLYDDIAGDCNNPPEPIEEDFYDDIQNGPGKAESIGSVASAVSDSEDHLEATEDDMGNGVVPEGSPAPEDGKNTPTLNRKEMSKLKKQEKEKEKQLEREKRLQKKKDEEEKKQRERMEAQRKRNFDRTKKPFKLKGSEQTKFVAQTIQAVTKAKKLYLTFKEGEEVDVLFTKANEAPNKEFPEGAWLVVKSDGQVGYIDETCLESDERPKSENATDGYGDGEDLYEDITSNAKVSPQERPLPSPNKSTLPPPSSPAPPPPGSLALPPRSTGGNFVVPETQESYDDVTGGELIEEDMYEELDN